MSSMPVTRSPQIEVLIDIPSRVSLKRAHEASVVKLAISSSDVQRYRTVLQDMSADKSSGPLEEDVIAIKGQLVNLQARYGDLEEEHTKMEEKMAERATGHERLLTTVTRLEKRNKTLVKRQASQEEAFELERQEKIEVEKTLTARIQQLQQELQAVRLKLEQQTPPTPPPWTSKHTPSTEEPSFVAQVAIVSQLRAELADMAESQLSLSEMHMALQLQVHNLEHEVAERTAECYRLREENEGFEILLRERTLDGRVYDADVFGDMSEDDMSEDKDSDVASLVVGGDSRDKYAAAVHMIAPTHGTETSRARKKPQVLNLAEDLGATASTWDPQSMVSPITDDHSVPANDQVSDGKHHQAVGAAEDITILNLRAEVKALMDANKALRLYCSKILDRILLHDDEEQFLVNVSGSMNKAPTQRSTGMLGTDKRQAGARDRRAVTPEIYARVDPDMGFTTRSEVLESQALGPEPSGAATATNPKVRADEIAILHVVQSGRTLRPLSIVAKKEAREKEIRKDNEQHERRLHRGFSLDWRSLSGTRRAEPEPFEEQVGAGQGSVDDSLCPPRSPHPNRPAITHSVSHDRKLDISEEDEEDRTERERLATTLKLMGIATEVDVNLSTPQGHEENLLARGDHNGAKPAGAFSRFSAFFGRPTAATAPCLIDDARSVGNTTFSETASELAASGEVRTRRHQSKAESQSSDVAEPEAHLSDIMEESRRTRAKRQTLSTSQVENISEALSALHNPHRRTVGGDASLSTLWSLGSDDHDS